MVGSPISGFMPIPLAIMPPFMAYQSILMGDAFGKGFQYGKRKISAMSNDEFNKLDLSTLFEESVVQYKRMVPTVKEAMDDSKDLQNHIVKQLFAIIPNLLKDFFGGESDDGLTSRGYIQPSATTGQTDSLQNVSIQALQSQINELYQVRYAPNRKQETPDTFSGFNQEIFPSDKTKAETEKRRLVQEAEALAQAKAKASKKLALSTLQDVKISTGQFGGKDIRANTTVTITFNLLRFTKTFANNTSYWKAVASKKQTYRFSVSGHARKLKSILKLKNSTTINSTARKNANTLYINYLRALHTTYKNTGLLKWFT